MAVDYAQELKKFIIFLPKIYGAKCSGFIFSLARLLSEAGYNSESEFWKVAISEPISEITYAHLLRDFIIAPIYELERPWQEEVVLLEANIKTALRLAKSEEPSLFVVVGEKPSVRPKELTEWLLSKPMRADLVPSGLKAFIEGSSTSAPQNVATQSITLSLPSNQKPRRTARKRDPIITAIIKSVDDGEFTIAAIEAMSGKEIGNRFIETKSKPASNTIENARRDALKNLRNRNNLN